MSADEGPRSWHPTAMRSFRIVTRLAPLAAAVVTLLTLSCKDKPAENAVDAAPAPAVSSVAPATTASAPASASASVAASGGGGHGDGEGRRGHGGPSEMLFTAAKGLELKDEQKTKVEAARTAAHAGPDDATREAMKTSAKDLHSDLVAGIKAGKIETAKLEPRYAAIEKAAQVTHEKEAEGLNALHAALDATQRKTAVADVRAKMAARENKWELRDGGHGGHGGPDGGRGPGGKRSIDRLTRGLDLDGEQQKKVDGIAAKDDGKGGRPDPIEMKKRVETLLLAFEKDTFDAKKVDAFDARKARGMMDHESKVLVQLVPILKPEQREKLAAKLEKGQSPHGRRGPGGSAGFGHRQPAEDDDDD